MKGPLAKCMCIDCTNNQTFQTEVLDLNKDFGDDLLIDALDDLFLKLENHIFDDQNIETKLGIYKINRKEGELKFI